MTMIRRMIRGSQDEGDGMGFVTTWRPQQWWPNGWKDDEKIKRISKAIGWRLILGWWWAMCCIDKKNTITITNMTWIAQLQKWKQHNY